MEFIIDFFDLCVSSKKIGSKKIEKTLSFFQKIGKLSMWVPHVPKH